MKLSNLMMRFNRQGGGGDVCGGHGGVVSGVFDKEVPIIHSSRFSSPLARTPQPAALGALAPDHVLAKEGLHSTSSHSMMPHVSEQGLDLIEPAADMGFGAMARRPKGPQAHEHLRLELMVDGVILKENHRITHHCEIK